MPACHAGGRGFESLPGRQFNILCWCGSTVEQLTCNQQVVGSIPIASSILWPLGQAVKTPPFHGGNRGSIPLGVTILYGSIAQLGEHLPYKQRVTGSIPVVSTNNGSVAQLVRVPACHAGGRGFESLPGRQFNMLVWLNGRAADL